MQARPAVASGKVEAGSYQTFTLVYTAGEYGVDDSGSLRICFRFASDSTRRRSSDARFSSSALRRASAASPAPRTSAGRATSSAARDRATTARPAPT